MLPQLDSEESFYQSWGAPVVAKYCERGYPKYIDAQGTDGEFNWYCYIQGAQNVACKATKGANSSTPTPTITNFTVDKTQSGPTRYINIQWSSQNATSCTISAVANNATEVFFQLPGQSPAGSMTREEPVYNGTITYRAVCNHQGVVNSSVSTVNLPGASGGSAGGGTVGGGTNYTYTWKEGGFGACTGPCGTNNGIQTQTVTCLRNDGETVLGSYCASSSASPAIERKCTASACGSVKCAGGSDSKKSPDNSNTCYFSWQDTPAGQSAIASAPSGGGILNGVCGSDGEWDSWNLSCPNVVQTVSCQGGGRTVKSADNSNTCIVSYDEKNA
jgi:hypothetical protein